LTAFGKNEKCTDFAAIDSYLTRNVERESVMAKNAPAFAVIDGNRELPD
jgi:hypothetical protein